jgi:hypothetical protein
LDFFSFSLSVASSIWTLPWPPRYTKDKSAIAKPLGSQDPGTEQQGKLKGGEKSIRGASVYKRGRVRVFNVFNIKQIKDDKATSILLSYPDMVVLVGRVAHRKFRDHLRVVGNLGGWAHHGRSDISCAAALYT